MIKKYELFENIHKDIDPYGEEDWTEKKLPYEYDTTLNIGAIINPVVYMSVYKVVIEHTHGDADAYAYTYSTYYEEYEDVVKDMINFCAWVNEKWISRDKLNNISDIVFGEDNDFLQGDSTADGQFPASPRIENITYFDNGGIEHRVNINKRKIR